MPIATVNDEGAFLYYEDSGAPEGVADYTTIFMAHGLVFHSGALQCCLFRHETNHSLRCSLQVHSALCSPMQRATDSVSWG